jgi:EmrB/QacA subfamily drug resistance transporter
MTVLFIGVLMAALDIAIVGPALPAIQKQFGSINERSLAWIYSVYVLFNLIGTPLMAKLSDLYGRRTIYILDAGLFALGSFLVAISPSFWVLMIGRGIQGFGAGGIFPVASAVIGDTFPPEKRGGALGLIGAVFGLAFIVGPILGGLLLGFGWRWLFLINLPIALVVIALSIKTLPSKRQEQSPKFDALGMVVLSLALAGLAFGLNQIDTTAFFSSLISVRVLPFLAAAIVFGFLLVKIEKKAASPIIKLDLFAKRQLRLSYILSAGAGIGEASLSFMTLLAVAALKVSVTQASYLLMPIVLAMAVGSPVAGRMLDKFGSKVVILMGTVTLTAGMFLLSQNPENMAVFIVSGALIGFGLSSLLGAPARYISINEVAPSERSVAQGVLTVFTSIGQLVGAALVGAVANSRGGGVQGYSSAFLMIAVLSALLILGATMLKNHEAEKAGVQAQTLPEAQLHEAGAD